MPVGGQSIDTAVLVLGWASEDSWEERGQEEELGGQSHCEIGNGDDEELEETRDLETRRRYCI